MTKPPKAKVDFIKYGKWDTIEHARNGLKPEQEHLAQARLSLYNVHEKAKKMLKPSSL